MPKTNTPYLPDFRAEAARSVRSKRQPIAHTARDLGVSYEALRHWIKQAELDQGLRTDGLTTAGREDWTEEFPADGWTQSTLRLESTTVSHVISETETGLPRIW